ncbi:DUF3006 domain-containing protein [Deinococcus cavernae]|uniref:DUF3006 domain-containing protein n=1 Tax=Deinococcus cavernae TaxID=2320857 RepID=A0A418VEH8_9DEIO|nr:DUF3006 domain-containing protein [Deinococcus cavernae]RJF74495.1 DUF3006 domain-containing protein [Deinococcus cavernae]
MSKHRRQEGVSRVQVIIDALEGDKARVELPDGQTADWDRARLPDEAKEGDVITVTDLGAQVTYVIDHEATHQRRTQAQASLEALNHEAPKGEIEL